MQKFYSSTFLVLSSIFLLLAGSAAGQQLRLEEVKVSDEGNLLAMAGGYSIAHYVANSKNGPTTVFRHVVLDSMLRVRHERVLRLGGRNAEAVSCTSNRRAALYTFRWWTNSATEGTSDSTVTAVIDTAGSVLSLKRIGQATNYPRPDLAVRLASDSLFLQAEPLRGQRGFQLRCLNLRQRERWQLTFKSRKRRGRLLHCTVDTAFVWLVMSENMRSRRITHTVHCVELKTGRLVSSTPLDYQGERRIASAVLPGPNNSLLVTGRSYQRRRINRKYAGNLFFTRLAPDGTHQLDHLNYLAARPGALGPRPKTYWHAMAADSAGNVHLLGQAFTSTSYATNMAVTMATSLATLGILRASATTFRSQELVRLTLNPRGEIVRSSLIPLPGRNIYTFYGTYVPGQLMAELAQHAGLLPVRSLSADGRTAVLRTGNQLALLDFGTQQLRPLRQGVRAGEVWQHRPGALLLYHTEPGSRHTLELERVSLAE